MSEERNHQVDDLPFEAGDVLGMFCCLLSMFIHGLSPVWLVNLHVWWMSSQLGGIHISGLPILFMMPGLVLRKQGVLYN